MAAEAAIDDEGNSVVVRPDRQFEQPDQLSAEPPAVPDSNTPVFTPTTQTPPVPETPPEQTTPETTPEFVQQLHQAYGITPEDLKFGIEYMKQQVQVQQLEQIHRGVQEMWGVDTQEYNQRMQMVTDEFKRLPETERAKYDNVQGIYALWDRISRSQRAQQVYATGGNSANTPAQSSPYDFTEEQINNMTPEERQKNDRLILKAYAERRVKLS